MLTELEEIEIQEAIDAADIALDYLENASALLNKASHWGIFDMIGGGPIATIFKRNKMSQAQQEMDKAKLALRDFSRELNDLSIFNNIELNVTGFIDFADFFFDNFFVDFLVQDKINKARYQVEEAIESVTRVQDELLQLLESEG